MRLWKVRVARRTCLQDRLLQIKNRLPSKDRSVISGNPDLNPPKIEEPLKMEREGGPFRLIDKTARGLACKAAFRKKNKPSFESLLS